MLDIFVTSEYLIFVLEDIVSKLCLIFTQFYVIVGPYLEGYYLCFPYCNRNLQYFDIS